MDCSMASMILILFSARGRRYGSGPCIAMDLYLLGTNYTLSFPTQGSLVAIYAGDERQTTSCVTRHASSSGRTCLREQIVASRASTLR